MYGMQGCKVSVNVGGLQSLVYTSCKDARVCMCVWYVRILW